MANPERRSLSLVNALDVSAQRHFLKAIGIGGNERIGAIVRDSRMAVEHWIPDHGATAQIFRPTSRHPIVESATPVREAEITRP